MGKDTDVYRQLQEHLDKMPIGYPATETGVELRLLRFMFTPEEARIALYLDYKYKTLEQVYEDAKESGISLRELESGLEAMADKGTIFIKTENNLKLFASMPFVVGMMELPHTRATPEFLQDTGQYFQEKFAAETLGLKVPQTRVIPIGKKHHR